MAMGGVGGGWGGRQREADGKGWKQVCVGPDHSLSLFVCFVPPRGALPRGESPPASHSQLQVGGRRQAPRAAGWQPHSLSTAPRAHFPAAQHTHPTLLTLQLCPPWWEGRRRSARGGLLRMGGGGKQRSRCAERLCPLRQIWGAEKEARHPAAGVRTRAKRGAREPQKRECEKKNDTRLLVFVVSLSACAPARVF